MKRIFEEPLYSYRRSSDQDARQPVRRKVVVIGAGPVGLAAAIDLALCGIEVVILDDNDRVSSGSRAICLAKRTLEIFDRLGCGDRLVEKGVVWNRGKVFFKEERLFEFDLLPEEGHRRPAFINLQQYHLEHALVGRLSELATAGHAVDLRGRNRLRSLAVRDDHALLSIDTPEGPYEIEADWVIACDGANSTVRACLGLDFRGRVFEDNFLIADVVMEADFPSERWFWFDPPFNPGQSALLHKQPDGVWRIDLQLGHDIDREEERRPDKVIARLEAMLGPDVRFALEWVSIYTFECRRMERFLHRPVIFAGDSAHQVSPFGARGANSGIQDVDNLVWKLRLVIDGAAPASLLESYDDERILAADENITNSTRSTDFITPKSQASRAFRDAVLDLARSHGFARPLVNSGRLSTPCLYDASSLNGPDVAALPQRTRPGAPACDAPLAGGWLLDQLGGAFSLLAIDCEVPDVAPINGVALHTRSSRSEGNALLKARYLGDAAQALYLVRPDQHIAARFEAFDEATLSRAIEAATGRC